MSDKKFKDDGRTVLDMSSLETVFPDRARMSSRTSMASAESAMKNRSFGKESYSAKEVFRMTLAVYKSVFPIALAYIGGFTFVLGMMLLFYGF